MYENVELANQIFDDLLNESVKDCMLEKQSKSALISKVAKQKLSIMNWIRMILLRKLLGKFKLVITCYYEDKKLFEFEIPKN